MTAIEQSLAMLAIVPATSDDIEARTDVNHRCQMVGLFVRLFKQHVNALQSFEMKNA
jgi:hypothetical protein